MDSGSVVITLGAPLPSSTTELGHLANVITVDGMNGDGIADVLVGSPLQDVVGADAGAVYIVWFGQGNRTIDLAAIAQAAGGAKIVGAAGSLTGASLGFGGDLNGDGTVDLIIGQPGTGEQVKVLFTPTYWQPDASICGTNSNDIVTPALAAARI